MKTKLLGAGICSIFVLVLLAAACAPAAPQTKAKIRVGWLPTTQAVPLALPLDKGWYQEEGLEVEMVRFASGTEVIAALVAGQLDIGGSGMGAGTVNAIERGADIKYLASWGQSIGGDKEKAVQQFVIRKDLWDSGVRTLKDLKGKKLAAAYPGSFVYFVVDKMANKEGLKVDDFQIENLGLPKRLDGFKGKSLDASIVYEPFTTQSVKEGLAVLHSYETDYLDKGWILEVSQLYANGDWLKKNEDAARRFLKAYTKAVAYYTKAKDGGDNLDEVATLMEKWTDIKKDIAIESHKSWAYIPSDGKISKQGTKALMEHFKSVDKIQAVPSEEQLYMKGVSLVN